MTNLMELKDMIADEMGVSGIPFDHYDAIAGEAVYSFGDVSKAKSMGWENARSGFGGLDVRAEEPLGSLFTAGEQ